MKGDCAADQASLPGAGRLTGAPTTTANQQHERNPGSARCSASAIAVTQVPGGVGILERCWWWENPGQRESIAPAIVAVLLFRLITYWLVLVPGTSLTGAFPESSTEGYDGTAVLGQHESELASPPPEGRYQAIAKPCQMTGLDQGDTDHAFART